MRCLLLNLFWWFISRMIEQLEAIVHIYFNGYAKDFLHVV
jgi:hypothetical protein